MRSLPLACNTLMTCECPDSHFGFDNPLERAPGVRPAQSSLKPPLCAQALLPLLAPQLAGGEMAVAQLVGAGALVAALGPSMWHMWVYLGSANANFYYAVTLLWGAWQVPPPPPPHTHTHARALFLFMFSAQTWLCSVCCVSDIF